MKLLTATFGIALMISGVVQAQTIGERKENQQDRIAQGVKSGELKPGETANLENRERALNAETSADRKANGGKLTRAERRRVNRQQNRLSKQIYNKKHN